MVEGHRVLDDVIDVRFSDSDRAVLATLRPAGPPRAGDSPIMLKGLSGSPAHGRAEVRTAADDGTLVIEVADRGGGLAAQCRGMPFEPFQAPAKAWNAGCFSAYAWSKRMAAGFPSVRAPAPAAPIESYRRSRCHRRRGGLKAAWIGALQACIATDRMEWTSWQGMPGDAQPMRLPDRHRWSRPGTGQGQGDRFRRDGFTCCAAPRGCARRRTGGRVACRLRKLEAAGLLRVLSLSSRHPPVAE